MSNVNNQFKELINEAIHNYFHDDTETEMILKDWLYGICEQVDEYEKNKYRTHVNDYKAEAFDEIIHAINISSQPRQSGRRYIDKFEFTKKAENIIEKYESGGSDD